MKDISDHDFGGNELDNARFKQVASLPATPFLGQTVFLSEDGITGFNYCWSGSSWTKQSGGSGGGGTGAGYTHTQTTPSTVWNIEHGLGYDPAGIEVISDGYNMDGYGVQYLTTGQSLRLSFDISLAGIATLS